MRDFVHLHGHTVYSEKDSLVKIKQLVKRTKELGMKAVAVSEHGHMASIVKVYKECTEQGIKPILGCCLPDQMIYTINGPKEIKDIRVGDLVLTHNGVYKKVLRHWSKNFSGTLYGIDSWNSNTVWLTDEHPVYIRHFNKDSKQFSMKWIRADSIDCSKKNKRYGNERKSIWENYSVLPKVKIVAPRDINILDYLDTNIYGEKDRYIVKVKKKNKYDSLNNIKKVPAKIPINYKFMKLLGYFLAEGSFDYNNEEPCGIRFTFNSKELYYIDDVVGLIKDLFDLDCYLYTREHKSTTEVMCGSIVLSTLLLNLVGRKCKDKLIPTEFLSYPIELQSALLRGIANGDGKITESETVIKLANKKLIYQIKLLLANLGYASKITEVKEGNKLAWSVRYSTNINTKVYYHQDIDYIYTPVKNVLHKEYEGLVYNFEVEDDNSYVTDIILHNCEFYMTEDLSVNDNNRYHIVCLAKNNIGLRNLYKLASKAGMNKLKGKTKDYPRTDEATLRQHTEGLIVLSACIGGIIPRLLIDGKYDEAKQKAVQYSKMFEHFYLELQPHTMPEQLTANYGMLKIHQETNIPLVMTSDYHYLHKQDKKYHDILMAYGYRNPFTVDAYFMDQQEIENYCIANKIPLSAMDNTTVIADMIDIDPRPKDSRGLMPTFQCPEGYTESTYLTKLAMDALIEMGMKYNYTDMKDRIKRLIYELDVICSMGFSGYFLILWDWFLWCRDNGILMGKGRGCFLPGTKILMSDGSYKNIEDVSINDTVISHLGNAKEVYNTLAYDCNEEITIIKAANEVLRLTNDHEVWSMTTQPCQLNTTRKSAPCICNTNCNAYRKKCNKQVCDSYKLEWNKAGELKKNDYIVYPRNYTDPKEIMFDLLKYADINDKSLRYDDNHIWHEIGTNNMPTNKANRFIHYNEDLAKFLGYYIAEGSSTINVNNREYKICLGFNVKEQEYIEESIDLIDRIFNLKASTYTTINKGGQKVEFNNKTIANFLISICGKYSVNKHIPYDIVESGTDDLNKVLISYLFRGDGSDSDINNYHHFRIKYTSTSMNLVYQLRLLLSRFGYWGAIKSQNRNIDNWNTEHSISIEGKQLLKWNNDFKHFMIDMSKDIYKYHRNDFVIDDKYIYIRIKETLKKQYNGQVYDLSVKDDTSYIANSIAVHNSAAGSLVSYVLRITTIDPIVNGYYFERFLNPERIEFPDVDSDISKFDRAKAIGYLLNKYGLDYVAQIITFTKLQLKSTVKAGAKILNVPYEDVNKVCTPIPPLIDGNEVTFEFLQDVYANKDEWVAQIGAKHVATAIRCMDGLNGLFSKYPDLYDIVVNLSGCISGTGIHAGGVVVSSKVLSDHLPLTKGSDTAVLPLVQISMEDLDFFNALKIDALGLSTLSQVKICMDLVGLDMEWFDSEDFSDPEVYKLLREGLTTDIFQMGSGNAKRMIKDMNVSSLDELSDVNSGNRPGPLSKDKTTNKSMVDMYVENKKLGITTKIHPDIDYILEPTKGCMWYQEQIMAIGQVMGGYSLGNADLRIRKVLGKKKVKLIPEIAAEFIYGKQYDFDHHVMIDKPSKYCIGAIARGYSEELSKKVFNSMADFAKYSFK